MKLKPLVIAMGAAVPLALQAATLTAPAANKVSSEFLGTNAGITPAAASIALGSQYAVNDIITLSYSIPARAAASTATFGFANTLAIDVAGTTNDGVLSLFDKTDSSVSYRVTTAPGSDGTDFGTITTETPRFLSAEIANTDVTLSTASQTSAGVSFDAGKAVKVVDVTGSQFAYTVSGMSKTIDVESARKAFAVTGGTSTVHTITINVNDAVGSPDAGQAATAGTAAITLTGDFSWIDSNTATNATGIQTTGTITGDFSPVGVSATAITLASTGALTAAATYTIALTNATKQVIPVQSLGLTLAQNYGTIAQASATASGVYSLNGSSVTVYAVPTSSSVSNFIWLSNTGSTSGDVTITVYDGGETHELGVVGTSKAGAEFDVTAALNAGLEAAGVTLSGGRVHMDVVTNVPAADVAISAAYRVGDDRVNLLTSLETN